MLKREKLKKHQWRHAVAHERCCRGKKREVAVPVNEVAVPMNEYFGLLRRIERLEEALTIKTADCEMLLRLAASHNRYIFDKAFEEN